MIQFLVQNGHSWSSIKKYNLTEIGFFYKIICLNERKNKANDLLNRWMSNNYDQNSLIEVLKKLDKNINFETKKEPRSISKEEVKSEWSRLAQFMQKRK